MASQDVPKELAIDQKYDVLVDTVRNSSSLHRHTYMLTTTGLLDCNKIFKFLQTLRRTVYGTGVAGLLSLLLLSKSLWCA
jgi:hypothetical protein